jgi:hypothetical protein
MRGFGSMMAIYSAGAAGFFAAAAFSRNSRSFSLHHRLVPDVE